MWADLEKASKRAVTPSNVVAEVTTAVDSLPQEAIAAAVESSSLTPLLAEDYVTMCVCHHAERV